ncbi:MAG: hypothetical protein VX205_14945 [Pseudomonadota bacterium]|nr:hypothetical protein [Sphingobium sp.]MCC4254006.1 hypothetical protein [Sphingobium naphthae]MEC7931362.1 hypothetical protein [Pseudomonadota bacterium]MEC8036281.1 hypothetical protein [Pseudomonadota bacterium]
MQEFFMDYGLWLLIALLVIIGLVFLLSGKRKPDLDAPAEQPLATAPPPLADPVAVPPSPAPAAPSPDIQPAAQAEPIADRTPVADPTPPPAAEPIPASPAIAAPADDAAPDDLLRLKGVGPKLKALLIDLGVTRYAQIAAWSDADIAAIDARLGNFKGRPVRDQWVDQARYLAAGDTAGFEAKYGKL